MKNKLKSKTHMPSSQHLLSPQNIARIRQKKISISLSVSLSFQHFSALAFSHSSIEKKYFYYTRETLMNLEWGVEYGGLISFNFLFGCGTNEIFFFGYREILRWWLSYIKWFYLSLNWFFIFWGSILCNHRWWIMWGRIFHWSVEIELSFEKMEWIFHEILDVFWMENGWI